MYFMKLKLGRFGPMALVAALLAAGVAGQVLLAGERPVRADAADESMLATLGGFRSLAAEVIWYRAERMQDEGRFAELVQLTSMLTWLEPHDAEVWTYSSWNLAYNISVRMPREEDRWQWVHEAIRLLRDEGIRRNPAEASLYRELAFMFELKIGVDDNDTAAKLYREEWRKIVADVQARDAWGEIGMTKDAMSEIERVYGVSDWTNPQASAIYWAHNGLKHANNQERPFLNEILRQSVTLYRRQTAS